MQVEKRMFLAARQAVRARSAPAGSRTPPTSCFGAQIPLQPLDRLVTKSQIHLSGPHFSPPSLSFLRRFKLGLKHQAETDLFFRNHYVGLGIPQKFPPWRMQVPDSSIDSVLYSITAQFKAVPFSPKHFRQMVLQVCVGGGGEVFLCVSLECFYVCA